jgi:uncharacterized protein (TIGR03067 family)
MASCLSVFVGVGLLLAADKPGEEEVKRFQGKWTAQSRQSGDRKTPETQVSFFRLVIDEDGWKEGPEFVKAWKIKVDPSKDPKQLDLTAEIAGTEVVRRCVYELKGDTLTVCAPTKLGGERPGKVGPGGDVLITVYKRDKK